MLILLSSSETLAYLLTVVSVSCIFYFPLAWPGKVCCHSAVLLWAQVLKHGPVWTNIIHVTLDEGIYGGLYLPLNEPIVVLVLKTASVKLKPKQCYIVWYSCALNCYLLSEIVSSMLQYSEIIESRVEITFILDIDSKILNTGNFE